MNKKAWFYTFNVVLVGILTVVYLSTMAPDLTWANRGADGADLITAAYTGGVPHPSGYPSYMLIARVFQWIPLGTLAFRTNLMSGFFAILAALFTSSLTTRSITIETKFLWLQPLIGFLAGLAFGLSPLLWSQAVITEVYTLHAFFVALILILTPMASGDFRFLRFPLGKYNAWWDRLGGLVFGLAIGNQLTVIFLLPVWFFFGVLKNGDSKNLIIQPTEDKITFLIPRIRWRSLTRRSFWLLLGLTVYLIIPLRARSGSAINWGYAVDWEGMWWLISGELYQDRVFSLDLGYLWPRIRNWAGLLREQFGFPGLVIGFYGLLYGEARYRRFSWITVWIFMAYSLFAIGYNSSDSYVLLIPVFLVFTLWMGLGFAAIFDRLKKIGKSPVWLPITGILMIILILGNAWSNYANVDAGQDTRAIDFATNVLENAPENAILFVHEDEDAFTLPYYTFALGERPDLVILSEALVLDWYRQIMRETYPDLKIPEDNCYECIKQEIVAINGRPSCDVDVVSDQFLTCQP